MNYLGRFIDNFKYAYKEINAATLTGAIDVIVVEQRDGTYTCSPFHVRFGKLGVLRSREKIVEIEINGEPCNIFMKLGESGEAFFVENLPNEECTDIPQHLVCSPIPCGENVQGTDCTDTSELSHLNFSEEFEKINMKERRSIETVHVAKKFCAKKVVYSEEGAPSSDFKPIPAPCNEENRRGSEDEPMRPPSPPQDDGMSKLSSGKKKRRKKGKRNSTESARKFQMENDADCDIFKSCDQTSPNEDDGAMEESDADNSGNPKSVSIPSDLHFFSDTDADTMERKKLDSPVQSDTEFEISARVMECCDLSASDPMSPVSDSRQPSWPWGELPSPLPKSELSSEISAKECGNMAESQRSTLASMLGFMKRTKHIRQKSADGIYLSQLDPEELDPEIARLYLRRPTLSQDEKYDDRNLEGQQQRRMDRDEDDAESGNGTSLAQSLNSELGNEIRPDHPERNNEIAMSLCGDLKADEMDITNELFDQHIITFDEFCNDPSIFKNPNVLFRIGGSYYRWETACPMILSAGLFKQTLPKTVVSRLEMEQLEKRKKEEGKKDARYRRGYYSWFTWARSTQKNPGEEVSLEINGGRIGEADSLDSSNFEALNAGEESRGRTYSSTDSDMELYEARREKCRKTLRLTSEQIANLKLQPGANEVTFSVTTAYQGTTTCSCLLFSWRYDDKIVVSDIDGTITRSDVLGHILPIVGNDWSQSGVAKLFNRIENNGYKLLYLSARAIGQSTGTRRYLNSIKQENLTLPEGPLLLNPTSLLRAFHREVIEKKPEEFKISCLKDIQALFPPDAKPFYAGYGNKINDVWTYQAVGIPLFRIFTINHRGVLTHELTKTFQSSYLSMSQIADQLYPTLDKGAGSEDFSTFNYWRETIPNLEEGEDGRKSTDMEETTMTTAAVATTTTAVLT